MSKKFKIILTVSVVLNLLFAGAGVAMMHKKLSHFKPPEEVANLSPESRNIVARNFQEARKDIKNSFKKSKQTRRDIVEILRAKEFDAQAYAAAVQSLKDTQGQIIERKMQMLKELSAELPLEDRAKISDRFIKPHGPYRKGRMAKPAESERQK